MPISPLLIPAKDVAKKVLSVSEKTLWSWTAPRGPIPCVRIGRRVLYHIADLERFIEENKLR